VRISNLRNLKARTPAVCMRGTVQIGIAVTLYCCKKSVVHEVNCVHVSFKVFSAMIDFFSFHTMYRLNVRDGHDVSSFRVTELIPVDAEIMERRKFLETSIYIRHFL
jgi:hypothetical protein